MFEILTDQACNSTVLTIDDTDASHDIEALGTAVLKRYSSEELSRTFANLNVLVIETSIHGMPAIEPCLRYMTRYEALITQAGSNKAARFALSADTFDVVVTDVAGLAVINTGLNRNTPVIVITAVSGSEAEQHARKAGTRCCLTADTLSPSLLETAISEALRGVKTMP
jgi:CheY-like chemotaxis protein